MVKGYVLPLDEPNSIKLNLNDWADCKWGVVCKIIKDNNNNKCEFYVKTLFLGNSDDDSVQIVSK